MYRVCQTEVGEMGLGETGVGEMRVSEMGQNRIPIALKLPRTVVKPRPLKSQQVTPGNKTRQPAANVPLYPDLERTVPRY